MTYLVLAAALTAAQAPAQAPAAPAPSHTIATVAWLAGCWTSQTDTRQYDELWMKPAGGSMFGMSRTVARARTVASEALQLREENGAVFYIAKPSSQPEARFKLEEGRDGYARFENPEHDFPQIVTYSLAPDGLLTAQISGTMNGQPRAIDFPMRRGGC